ncbi:MAG TPA: macro domain-containing protein [Acidimicrobiales bacterium]|nr:macro domain-containing protein [Acidimicrobiales bacterium]
MISESHGNLLESDVEALVNTVNTVGVMGKGIALQFRRAFPAMFKEYERAAKHGDIQLGRMHVWQTDAMSGPKWIINFPTKGNWRAKSKLVDIEAGLADLVAVVRSLGIRSIAVPPLGCGNGGLQWHEVAPRIEKAFAELPEVDVRVFPPEATPAAAAMRTNSPRPKWTVGKAALVDLVDSYAGRALEVSLIEVQKLMYFLQVAGEPLNLKYTKGIYGPYAENLRHSLKSVEGHFLVGFGDGSRPVLSAEPIDVLPNAAVEARAFLAEHPATMTRIERVLELSEGFESAYAMELLSTVHWVVTEQGSDGAEDPERAARLVAQWSPRKQRMFGPDHVSTAWDHLHDGGWLRATVPTQ